MANKNKFFLPLMVRKQPRMMAMREMLIFFYLVDKKIVVCCENVVILGIQNH